MGLVHPIAFHLGRLPIHWYGAMVALTVYVIFEIEYPRLGLVRLDAIDRVMLDVRAGMK